MPTIQVFRNRFKWHNDGHPWIQLPEMEFLQKIGAYRIEKEKGEELPETITFSNNAVIKKDKGLIYYKDADSKEWNFLKRK